MFQLEMNTPQSLIDTPRSIFVLDQLVQYVSMKTHTHHVDVNVFAIENQGLLEGTSPGDNDMQVRL